MELKNIFYLTINLKNGNFYFGVHRTNPDIFDGYIGNGIYNQSCANKENYKLHKAVRKYGYENFRRTTIAIFPDTEEGRKAAFDLEAQIVTPELLKSKSCYNMVTGGQGGEHDSCNKTVYMFSLDGNFIRKFKNTRAAAEYIMQKNSKADDVESVRSSIKNNCLGKTNSSWGYFCSYIKKFNYTESKRLVKIAQYTYSGKFLRYWDSISEAVNAYNCDISQALMKNGTSGGYQWRYYTGDDSDIEKVFNYTTKNTEFPIIMIDKNGNEIEYENIVKCVEANPKLQAPQINRVLRGKIKSHFGYKFKYKGEDIV